MTADLAPPGERGPSFGLPSDSGARALVVAVTALPGADGAAATAAAVGVALARVGAPEPAGVVVLDAVSGSRLRPTLVSSAAARDLESKLCADLSAVARGAICAVNATVESLPHVIDSCRGSGAEAVVVNGEPVVWRDLVDTCEVSGAVLRADAKAA